MTRPARTTAAVVAAAAASLAVVGVAQAQPRAPARPDVAVVAVSAPRAVLAGAQFELRVTLAERSRRAAARAAVSVAAGASVTASPAVEIGAGGRAQVTVPLTLPAPGTATVTVRATVARDAAVRDNVRTARITAAEFAVAPTEVLVDGFAGYGAQFNQHVYAGASRDAGVSDDNVGDMEAKIVALAPQFVRLFFTRSALTDPDRMASFVRTAQLAQRAGATINVTLQALGPTPEADVPAFGHALADLVLNRGVTNLRWATIQNEVNATRVTTDAYDAAYRLLDATLRQDGVRDRVRLMGGDLVAQVSPLGQTQADWFGFMASRMTDVLDAYSVHVYWNYWDADKIQRRLKEVRAIVDGLPAEARKPLYVTEYGVRGKRSPGDGGPGGWDDGTPLESTNVSAFQQAWFALLAAQLGYSAAVKWDAYFGRYDAIPQAYTMIGPPTEGWPLRPSYAVTRLLTRDDPGGLARRRRRPRTAAAGADGLRGPDGRADGDRPRHARRLAERARADVLDLPRRRVPGERVAPARAVERGRDGRAAPAGRAPRERRRRRPDRRPAPGGVRADDAAAVVARRAAELPGSGLAVPHVPRPDVATQDLTPRFAGATRARGCSAARTCSFSTFGHTVTLTSPRWAVRSRSIIVRDWPIPPPIESGIAVLEDRPVVRQLEEVELARELELRPQRLLRDADAHRRQLVPPPGHRVPDEDVAVQPVHGRPSDVTLRRPVVVVGGAQLVRVPVGERPADPVDEDRRVLLEERVSRCLRGRSG